MGLFSKSIPDQDWLREIKPLYKVAQPLGSALSEENLGPPETSVAIWMDMLNDDPLRWLLEPDPVQPGPRYLALRDLMGRQEDDDEVREAHAAVMATGPVPAILAA